MCMISVSSAIGGQEGALDPLELGLQMVAAYCVGALNQTGSLQVLLISQASLLIATCLVEEI